MIEDQYLWLCRNDQRRQELEELIYNRYKPLYIKVGPSPSPQVLESLRLARRAAWRVPEYSMDVYSMRRNCYTPRQSEELIDWKHEGF